MKPTLLLAAFLLITQGASLAQNGTIAELPRDPKAALALFKEKNGLSFAPPSSWHIRIAWDQFDEDGDNVHSGTIEEFYATAHRYKIIYTGDLFHQQAIANDSAFYMIGDNVWPGVVELQVENEVMRPFHRVDTGLIKRRSPAFSEMSLGTARLSCIEMRRVDAIETGPPKYCTDLNSSRLRYVRGKGWDETVYNKLSEFDGRVVARDIAVTHGGKQYLKIRVESLEPLQDTDTTLFAPPAGSLPLTGRIKVPSVLLDDDYLMEQGQLDPSDLKGIVRLRFVVGKDGRVIEAVPLDGLPLLQKAAIRTMRQYRFRPFLILDQPYEVEGNMEFSWN